MHMVATLLLLYFKLVDTTELREHIERGGTHLTSRGQGVDLSYHKHDMNEVKKTKNELLKLHKTKINENKRYEIKSRIQT